MFEENLDKEQDKEKLDQLQSQKEKSDLRDASSAGILSGELDEQDSLAKRESLMMEIRENTPMKWRKF